MNMTMEAMRYQGDHSLQVDHIASGAIVMGEVIDLGNLIGICTIPGGIASGALGCLETKGVFRLKSASGTLFSQTDEVYWDVANDLAVAGPTSATVVFAGVSVAAKVSGDTDVKTDINIMPPQFGVGYSVTTTTT